MFHLSSGKHNDAYRQRFYFGSAQFQMTQGNLALLEALTIALMEVSRVRLSAFR
jgi:hypothetical protein